MPAILQTRPQPLSRERLISAGERGGRQCAFLGEQSPMGIVKRDPLFLDGGLGTTFPNTRTQCMCVLVGHITTHIPTSASLQRFFFPSSVHTVLPGTYN